MRLFVVFFIISFVFFDFPRVYGQESLLLGEIKLEDIRPDSRTDKVKKILVYGMKYKKNGRYKDSTIQVIEDYSAKGELLVRTTFGGKKGERSYKKTYTYDNQGNVISYVNMAQGGTGVQSRVANFVYNGNNQVVRQNISLANIVYTYYSDGRLKTKAYYYNNGGMAGTEPWVLTYFYDDSLNLIHVDTDSSFSTPTSVYNEKNELVKHDYYPGVAYSTYQYNEKGHCIKQVDYETGKKGWDSTQFFYHYNDAGILDESSTINSKGKFSRIRKRVFNSKGQLDQEIFYRKKKPKRVYRYSYSYFKE